MFKKTALVAGLGLALSATAQAEYRFEAGLGLSGGDLDGYAAGGTFYFSPVDDSKGPLGEAAFLDKSSFASVTYGESEFDDSNNETESIGAGGRFVFGDGGWIVDAGYQNDDRDFGGESDTISIGGGKYLTDTTTLVLSYGNFDPDLGEDLDIYGIDLDHLMEFGDSAIKLHGGYATTDSDLDNELDFISIDATWYPCRSVGLGVGYGNTDGGNIDEDEYRIGAEWFINERVAASATYLETEDGDLETDSFIIGVSVRF